MSLTTKRPITKRTKTNQLGLKSLSKVGKAFFSFAEYDIRLLHSGSRCVDPWHSHPNDEVWNVIEGQLRDYNSRRDTVRWSRVCRDRSARRGSLGEGPRRCAGGSGRDCPQHRIDRRNRSYNSSMQRTQVEHFFTLVRSTR